MLQLWNNISELRATTKRLDSRFNDEEVHSDTDHASVVSSLIYALYRKGKIENKDHTHQKSDMLLCIQLDKTSSRLVAHGIQIVSQYRKVRNYL